MGSIGSLMSPSGRMTAASGIARQLATWPSCARSPSTSWSGTEHPGSACGRVASRPPGTMITCSLLWLADFMRRPCEQGPKGDTLNQRPHADGVVVLAGPQDETHQGAEGADKGDNLGRQAAARAADGLGPGPPFAPLAFGWTVTMVPSTRAYSKSGSPDRHSKTRAKTPPFTQRRKRWKTLFQLPKSLGRSRQGTPVRTRHSTASRNSRLSLAVAPGSEGLPGQQRGD